MQNFTLIHEFYNRVNGPYFGHLWTKTHITMTVTTVNIKCLSLKHQISFGQSKYV